MPLGRTTVGSGRKQRKGQGREDGGYDPSQEPGEKPFSLSVPDGWQISGRVTGARSAVLGGPAHIIAGKLDLAVSPESLGAVFIRWVPELSFLNENRSSLLQNRAVYPTITAVQFIQQILFPVLHRNSENVQFTLLRSLPQAAQRYQQRVLGLQTDRTLLYDGGICRVTYCEKGVSFEERLFTLTEIQAPHTGLKGNRETVVIRAPLHEFEQWLPLLGAVHRSLKFSGDWIEGEISRQMKAGMLGSRSARDIQTLAEKLAAHHEQTKAEIHRELF